MRRIATVAAGAVAVVAILALGVAVAGLASSGSFVGIGQTTSEETTETTEKPKTTRFRAVATAGAEVPKPAGVKAGARGILALTKTESSGSFSIAWTLTFRNLTGRAQAAHIHRGKVRKAGPVLVSLCGPCRSGQKGKASVSKGVAAAIKSGRTYVNVHTARNQAGEIRGQIKKR
ncbi:MAG TPA: CHRD domain-containing protein [Gaiellaceae bacterium]|nr:CHRD domain-containing protein [Gaiellaceae bacterium]